MSQIDLNSLPNGHGYSVSIEKEETPSEQKVRLFKDVALFVVAIIFVGCIAFLCVYTFLSTTASADEKKWAMSVLFGATSGVIGYLLKK